MSFGDQVSRLADDREAARRRRDPVAVARITRELDKLYAAKRQRVAQEDTGTNTQIVKRARIEVELERLMSSNGKKRS